MSVKLTRPQREALARVHRRIVQAVRDQHGESAGGMGMEPSYRDTRRTVLPGPGCVMVPFAGMWLGIEPDGYTHS